ncbi:hypothetical protein PVIIG_05639 [Plasmodium vivax India VII]|uniref:Variable surface protein Vir21 n=1 Tax=Plasmodium vivax India VII TaxID=1077284 RepID=A0A0J9UUM2_PLAVI|nr:hypothetical protein PVIIG_05639 [Plasmodium vivax India VII]
MSIDKEYILSKIKEKYIDIGESKFYKIYEIFDRLCNSFSDTDDSCLIDSTDVWKTSHEVTEILKKLYSNLFRVYVTIPGNNNTYFENLECKDYKLCYISLKYWLYDQIIIKEIKKTKINEIFTVWDNHIKNKIAHVPENPCVFNKLTLDEMKRLKNIYALYTVLYDNNSEFETCNENTCKYLEYFGKGLDDIISSIKSCSSKVPTDNYCKEFDEFVNICKDESLNSGISMYYESTKSTADTDGKYLLYSEKYKDQQIYIYLKDKNMLNYVKTSDLLSNKNSTIAATSVVGSAIGLSSIFYYFYKVRIYNIFKYKYFTIKKY